MELRHVNGAAAKLCDGTFTSTHLGSAWHAMLQPPPAAATGAATVLLQAFRIRSAKMLRNKRVPQN
jgi:hypothetical protein